MATEQADNAVYSADYKGLKVLSEFVFQLIKVIEP